MPCGKEQPFVMRGLLALRYQPDLPTSGKRRGGGLEVEFGHVANDSFSHAYILNPSRNSGHQGSHGFLVGERIRVLGR